MIPILACVWNLRLVIELVIISWRILVSFRGLFWRLYFCMVKYFEFSLFFFCHKILFWCKMARPHKLWHTPLLRKSQDQGYNKILLAPHSQGDWSFYKCCKQKKFRLPILLPLAPRFLMPPSENQSLQAIFSL